MNTKNSKKIVLTVLTAIIVISMLAAIAPVSANNGVTSEQKNESIAKGLAWLAEEQDKVPYGVLNPKYYPVASTAFAVLKFEHHAKEILKIDPFDPDYEYSDNIVAGLEYIFNHSYYIDIDKQWNGSDLLDPDVNRVNGKGIYFMSPGSDNRPLYETGIVMMALEASCHPNRVVKYGNHAGLDYSTVMKDTVDYIAWAQNDWPNSGRGGWRYGAFDNGTITGPGWGGPYSDNSVSQWPVLGLMSAAGPEWGIEAPDWVKTELLNHWLVDSQNANGCFGYTSSTGGGVVAMTASGLVQLTYCGVTTADPRWQAARQCICKNWNIGNFYAMYGVMKAAMTAQPKEIWWYNCTEGTHEWQPEYDAWLIANQVNVTGCWPPQYGGTGVLSTEWALLILQKVVPPPLQNPLWHEINKELVSLKDNVSAADMPNIIKRRLVNKLVYAEELKHNAKIVCEEGNFDGATKKLGVAKNQVESFASMVKITRRIEPEDKASFLAESAKIIDKIDRLIEYIETKQDC